MHMRRKPWARPELAVCPYFIKDPFVMSGRWRASFPKEQPLWAEFGCGKGGFLAYMGPRMPEVNFLGVDLKSDVLGVARRAISEAYGEEPVDNLRLSAFDLERLPLCMDENDRIDRLFIHFPNPWYKKSDHHKRLTHPKFLERYRTLLAPGAELWFKTDDPGLFEATQEYLNQSGYRILERIADLPLGAFGLPSTEHEARFRAEGKPIGFIRAVPDENVPPLSSVLPLVKQPVADV